eukprot:2553772-Prorocentrum_lima.AAC.1
MESTQLALQLSELRRLRAHSSNSASLNHSLDEEIEATLVQYQASRPPAARLAAIRATRSQLILRRDKLHTALAALQQQAQDNATA